MFYPRTSSSTKKLKEDSSPYDTLITQPSKPQPKLSKKTIVSIFVIFLLPLQIAILDSTGFFCHLTLYLWTMIGTSVFQEYLIVWLHNSQSNSIRLHPRLVHCMLWIVVWFLFPWEGVIHLWLSSGTIIAVFSLLHSTLAPGTLIYSLALVAITSGGIFFHMGAGSLFFLYVFLATSSILWRNHYKSHSASAFSTISFMQGTLLFVSILVVSSLFALWIFLSINSFWLHSPEVSKYDALSHLDPIATNHAYRIQSLMDLEKWRVKYNNFPVVIKPNVCTTNSAGVRLCKDFRCLVQYVKERQATGSRQDDTSWVIQDAVRGTELVVFFYRYPYYNQGYIKSLGIRKESDASNATVETNGFNLKANYFTDPVNHMKTPQFLKFFNDITANFKGYTGGRFDIMVEDIEKALTTGVGIHVLDVNIFPLGDIEEKSSGLLNKIRAVRTMILQLWMGLITILGGYQSDPILLFSSLPRLLERYYQCQNHENLWAIP